MVSVKKSDFVSLGIMHVCSFTKNELEHKFSTDKPEQISEGQISVQSQYKRDKDKGVSKTLSNI